MDNEKKLNILGLIIKIVVAVPALIFALIVMTAGVTADSSEVVKLEFMDNVAFTGAINITLYAVLLTVIIVLAFFIASLVTRPVQAIKSILGIIISGVLFTILYLIGTNDTLESLNVIGMVVGPAAI